MLPKGKSHINWCFVTISILLLSLVLIVVIKPIYVDIQQPLFNSDEQKNNSLMPLSITQEDLIAVPPPNTINLDLAQLNINLELRWKFDNIIHVNQETKQPIISLLTILSKQLNLTSAAHEQLMDLFNRYRDYKIALIAIKKQGPNLVNQFDIDDIWAFIELAHQTQFNYFTVIEIDAFFSNENTYDNQAIERISTLQDNTLSLEQKNMLIVHQISQMDDNDRQVYEPSLHVFNIVDSVEHKKTIINHFSPEIMERIEQLKQEELSWKTRVIKFQKFQIESRKKHITKAKMENLIADYRNLHFSLNERKRLQVFIDNPTLFNDN